MSRQRRQAANYVTNDVTPSVTIDTAATCPESRDASAQCRHLLTNHDDEEEKEEENSGTASTAAGGAKFLRLVSRDVVRFDT